MTINKCKIFGVLLLTFCIVFFVNTVDVKALDGYAVCYYTWTKTDASDQAGGNSIRPYKLGIVYYEDGGHYYMWADLGCGEAQKVSWEVTNYTETKKGICNIKNYDKTFGNADAVSDKFVKDSQSGFKCPSEVSAIGNSTDPQEISFYDCNQYPFNCTTAKLNGSTLAINGTPPTSVTVDGWLPENGTRVDNDGNAVTGSGTVLDGVKNTELVDSIVSAAGLGGYSLEDLEVGDPCNIINNNTVIMAILQFIIWLVCIGAIIVLIIMTIMDFTKAVTASDDMGLKKAFQKLIKRAIATVLLILLPAILTFIINFVNSNLSETGQVKIGSDGNLYCGVVDE